MGRLWSDLGRIKRSKNSIKKWLFFAMFFPGMAGYGSKRSFLLIFSPRDDVVKVSRKSEVGKCQTKLPSLNLISWNVKVWKRKWSTVPRRFRAEISTWERILEIILKYIWNTIINDQLYFVNTRYKFDRLYQTHRLRSKIAGVTLGENDSEIFE